jgi:acetyl esterase
MCAEAWQGAQAPFGGGSSFTTIRAHGRLPTIAAMTKIMQSPRDTGRTGTRRNRRPEARRSGAAPVASAQDETTAALDWRAWLYLEGLRVGGWPSVSQRSVQQARNDLRLMCDATSIWHPMRRVGDLRLPSAHGGIPARLYEPLTGRSGHRPLLVWFHGGGFVLGDLETADATSRALAHRSGALVLAIDYRRAPDPGCLAAADDAHRALRWALAHAAALGADPQRVIVGGESAGGTLSALACLRCRDDGIDAQPALQVLVYPCTDLSMALADRHPGTAQLLTWDSVDWFSTLCFSQLDPASPEISPYRAARHDGLPPALVITAECDLLCPDGEAYAAKLRDSGTAVTLSRHAGQIHGFFTMDLMFPAARAAQREVAQAIGALAAGPRVKRSLTAKSVPVRWRRPLSASLTMGQAFLQRLPATTLVRASATVLRHQLRHQLRQLARAVAVDATHGTSA